MRGYKEWVTEDKISFITNSFGRILYVNANWPDGNYEKWTGITKGLAKQIREQCRMTREFNLEELTLELL